MPSSNELDLARKKLTAIARAEFRLKQRLETLDWEDKELFSAQDNLKLLAAAGNLPEVSLISGGGVLENLKRLSNGRRKA